MCGFTAIHTSGRPILRDTLTAALETLRHRGPDDEGVWLADDACTALGHVRLSLVDLHGGRQPLSNEDEAVHAVVTGEIYDYTRLQRGLCTRGHRLRSRSDSEVLVHLYEEKGLDCLEDLRGEFAFALWDARRRRLFAARDRFGVKPLFYAHVGDTLVLASEVKALFAAGVPPAWSAEALHRALVFLPGRHQTLFRDVHQLPPGHWLTYRDGRLRTGPYWDLDYPADLNGAGTVENEREQVERLRACLEEATRLRLCADRPVGCLLSGGIDSSALLGIASRARDASALPTFTAAFPDQMPEETEAAQAAAAANGVRLRIVPVSADDLAEGLSAAVWHAETLGINLHGVGRMRLCEHLHRAGIRAALTGEGADELFAGYIQFRQDLDANAAAAANGGQNGWHGEPASAALAGVQARLGFVPCWLEKAAVRDSVFHALLSDDYAARMDQQDPFTAALDELDLCGQIRGRHPLLQSLYLWTRTVLPNYILVAERLEMAHAVEVRLPYLDHHLFEHVRTLGPHLLLRSGQEKYALREAVRPFVPAAIQQRSKQPFLAPPATTDPTSPLYVAARELLTSDAMKSLPFFDHRALRSLFESLPAQPESVRAALDAALLKVMSTALLQRHFRLAAP
jgi:asparagine synthase (glutamine-hydrolysing)